MSRTVVDASALIAYLTNEPGGAQIASQIHEALLCSVNLAEIIAVLLRHGTPIAEARKIVELSHVQVAQFDAVLAEVTADLIGRTRGKGLSLADCACLALAAHQNLPALTGDRAWRELDVGVEIQFIR